MLVRVALRKGDWGALKGEFATWPCAKATGEQVHGVEIEAHRMAAPTTSGLAPGTLCQGLRALPSTVNKLQMQV
jgi:hypothetical protein